MKEILRLQNISANHSKFGRIDNYNLSINTGELIYLLGLHGSGKRTLQEIIAGKITADKGNIYINEMLINNYSSQAAVEHGIAIFDSEKRLFVSLSVGENIILAMSADKNLLTYYDKKQLYKEAQDILSLLGWKKDVYTLASELNSFERMALSLAKAAKANFQLIVLDCMLAQLSYAEEIQFGEMISILKKRGISFLILNEKCNSLMDCSDKIEIMRKGRDVKTIYSDEMSKNDVADFITNEVHIYDFISNNPVEDQKSRGEMIAIVEMVRGTITSISDYLNRIWESTELFKIIDMPAGSEMINADASLAIIPMGSADLLIKGLSIGDNIAIVRYSRLANHLGIVTKGILRYLEKEFFQKCGVSSKKQVNQLSYVERKILSIHRFAIAGAKIIVLEEPFINLDMVNTKIIKTYIKTLREEGISVIFICSNPDEMGELCDDIVLFHKGKLIKKYTGNDVENIKNDISVIVK